MSTTRRASMGCFTPPATISIVLYESETISPSRSGFLPGSLNFRVSCASREAAAAKTRGRARRCLMPHSTPEPGGSVLAEEGVEEAVQALELLEAGPQAERGSEGGPDLGRGEEVVVMVAVDEPVPRPPLAGVVLELRREDGEHEVAAGFEDAGDLAAVPRPVARHHVVEAAVVEHDVERAVVELQVERVAGHERRVHAGP